MMISNESDEEIILSYKNGNREALKNIIDRYTSNIYNFTAKTTNKNDATDITQEVFIKVWKNIKKFDETKASFKTWIFTIAKNSTTDFLRKKKSIVFSDIQKNKDEVTFEENIMSEEILPDEALQKLEDAENLNRTLEKLRPEYREVLILHYQEEMTFEEIGKILNKPLNTAKSTHRRAVLELKKLLD